MNATKLSQAILAIAILAAPVFAEEIQLERDSAANNYESELPRIPATEPQDAIGKFKIAEGFRVELVAHEPIVTDPISMAFDEQGRLFVVCMRGYSEDGDDNLGVVKLLEDKDQNGTYETSTDYVEGLSWPTAVACYDGGVFVAAAPDILYCKDTDGDKVADDKRVVFTGFPRNNVQGMLNSFRWGLDNRLYGASGTNGGAVSSASSNDTVSLRGRDFSIDPATMTLRPESGGAQHGATFDRWGSRFVCSNSDHMQWVQFDDSHMLRNPLLTNYRARKSIAVDGASAEVYRTSPVEPWRIVRTRLRVKGMVNGPVEGGGRAAGYFTSASGLTAYTGDAFPQRYQDGDYLFVGDVGSNLVHLKQVVTEGLEKKAERTTPARTEFLTSTDNWFRPVQFANGPDGCLYMLDMYREVIEHPLSLPPMIKQHLDLTSGRSRGRIYRIVSADKSPNPRPAALPFKANDSGLVSMLGNPNGWHRETAARLIVTRSKASPKVAGAFAPLLHQACNADSPQARIRALYCLQSIDRLVEPTLVKQLRDEHPQVRRHALIVLELATHTGEATISQLEELVRDEHILVRYQLALTLGKFPATMRREMLTRLASESGSNGKMQFAVLSSTGDDRIAMLRSLLEANTEIPSSLLEEITRQIGQSGTDVADALNLVSAQSDPHRFRQAISLILGVNKRGPVLRDWLSKQGIEKPDELIQELSNYARQVAGSTDLAMEDRIFALRAFRVGEYKTEDFRELLSPTQSAEIRSAAVDELGECATPEAAKLLLQTASSLPPSGRRRAYELLTTRTAWAKALLESVTSGETPQEQIAASHRDRLLHHREPSVAERARELLGATSDRTKVLASYGKVLERKGDVAKGKTLFRKVCATCHHLDSYGQNVGPDLSPLRNRGAAYMLTNILQPNREVDSRYEAYSVVSTDGRSMTGLLINDSAESIELLQANGVKVAVEKSDLDLLQATGRSLMPDGLERDLGQQGIADVIAYLVSQ